MGILDSARQAVQQQAGWSPAQPQAHPTTVPPAGPVPEYDAEVNKGSISVRWLPAHLNKRAQQGWRLHTAFEKDGNTILIFERWR